MKTLAWIWRCRMCSHEHQKKSAGHPSRSCPHCGCRFKDWGEVVGRILQNGTRVDRETDLRPLTSDL